MKGVLEGFRILDKESQAVRVLHRIQTGRLVWRGAQQQFSHRHLHLFSDQRTGYFSHLHHLIRHVAGRGLGAYLVLDALLQGLAPYRAALQHRSRKGCSPDNAACEGFFGRLKTELFYPRDWQATTIEQFIQVVDSIRWYNEKRINISLGSLSPLEYRKSLGLAA